MRTLFLVGFAVSLLWGDSPLSETRQKLYETQRQKLLHESTKLKNSWISPLQLSATYNRSVNAGNFDGTSKKVGISLNQDIFRSGGIWYAIDYAKAFDAVQKLGIDLAEAQDLATLYRLRAQIARDTLKLKQARLSLKNREIDVAVVDERYRSGDADISEISRVTLQSDSARTTLISIENTLRQERYELKKLIGEKSVEGVQIPEIKLVDKDFYLAKHLQLAQLQKQIESDEARYKTVRSAYLPKLSVNANYGYSKFEGDFQNYSGDEYGYGLRLTMPLDINTKEDIQANKLAWMQSKIQREDLRKRLAYEYDQRVANIKDYEAKITVAENMQKRYEDLYRFTLGEYRAGSKTAYDVESLKNSVEIQKLEQQIQRYNILLEKIALFFMTASRSR